MANSAESEAKECVTLLAKHKSTNNESKRVAQNKTEPKQNRTEQNEKGDRGSLNFYINCCMHTVYCILRRKAKQMEHFGKS